MRYYGVLLVDILHLFHTMVEYCLIFLVIDRTDRIGVERPVIESSHLRDLQLPPDLMSIPKSLDPYHRLLLRSMTYGSGVAAMCRGITRKLWNLRQRYQKMLYICWMYFYGINVIIIQLFVFYSFYQIVFKSESSATFIWKYVNLLRFPRFNYFCN